MRDRHHRRDIQVQGPRGLSRSPPIQTSGEVSKWSQRAALEMRLSAKQAHGFESHLFRQHQATCNRRLLFVWDLALCLHKGQYTNKRKRAYGAQVAKRLARKPSGERRDSLERSERLIPLLPPNGVNYNFKCNTLQKRQFM